MKGKSVIFIKRNRQYYQYLTASDNQNKNDLL
jgi:hypothetical protein